ncbi:YicC/YloC family endoribonuclease [Amaricoccus sp.]|uniref:YicC/YloC family endoribonuclease n=1 Tax=Amaricoccus sp. TaxID=1872485 RepID=UPI001B732BE9|nr:YicC/YloC family endoribonuclease [Amaricoccus sp.]MBP7242032.1 YicC family protein [Amaricoccus sp.]
MPLSSMTGFADLAGGVDEIAWTWEARSVNGRGLDLRLRLPEGLEALDAPLRAALAAVLARGSVSVGLRMGQAARAGALPRLSAEALEAAIAAALAAGKAAAARGLDLAPMTAADLLGLRGVIELDSRAPSENPAAIAALLADVERLAAALRAARDAEGAAIAGILSGQLDRTEALVADARAAAEARVPRQAEALRARVEAALAAGPVVDEGRLAQELALLTVKLDVSEELDRLEAHVAAARALVAADGPVGRKLDFLTQEFNREANTLCSKAQSSELTAIGLELKVVVDQIREQVQNVE